MPSPANVHVEQALTNLAVVYPSPQCIADQIAPEVPVAHQSDKYYIIDAAREGVRISDDRRGLSAPSQTVDWATDTASYFCDEHSLEQPIDQRIEANSDNAVQPGINTMKLLMDKSAIIRDKILKANLDSAITATAAAGTVWTNPSSDPFTDILTGVNAIEATGVSPNVGWCDKKVWRALINHPDVVRRLQYTQVVTQAALANIVAEMFGLDRIIVALAFENTSLNATASLSRVWGTTFYLGYIDPNPSLQTMSLAYTFRWNASELGANRGLKIYSYWWQKEKSTYYGVENYYDQKVIAAATGYRITSAIS